jgi:hypothetical protein
VCTNLEVYNTSRKEPLLKKLFLAACTSFVLASETVYAGQPIYPPALPFDDIQHAQFGPRPTAAQLASSIRVKFMAVGRTGYLGQLSGEPLKMYLVLPDGSHQFGWAQAVAFELGVYAYRATVDYEYAFFQNGVLTHFSREPLNRCQLLALDLRGRSPVDACGSMDRLPKLEHNCMLPQNGAASPAGAACARLGDAVEMSLAYNVQETDHPIIISPGMTVSEAKRVAKSAGVAFSDQSPDRFLIHTSLPSVGRGFEAFLLRNGKIYARELHAAEFPDK